MHSWPNEIYTTNSIQKNNLVTELDTLLAHLMSLQAIFDHTSHAHIGKTEHNFSMDAWYPSESYKHISRAKRPATPHWIYQLHAR